jgi:hypothetical protein
MRTTITLRGRLAITYLRNGSVRIEASKPGCSKRCTEGNTIDGLRSRPRMHIRGDEFMRLIHLAAARIPPTVTAANERFGPL